MKEHVLYDPGQPVSIRRYHNETLAAVDQALLDANDIPAFLQRSTFSEVDPSAVLLLVRREDAPAAIRLLDAPPAADDIAYEPDDEN